MFGMDRTKTKGDDPPSPDGLPADVIVSPDALRRDRIPPGQSRTRKWPILDASGPPAIDLAAWRFRIGGLVGKEVEWNWEEFVKLPRVRVFSDFHCVTRWSRLGNLWEGVSTRELVSAGGRRTPGGPVRDGVRARSRMDHQPAARATFSRRMRLWRFSTTVSRFPPSTAVRRA